MRGEGGSIFWQMEDELKILANGWRPQYFGKSNTTSRFWKWRTTSANGRQHNFLDIEQDQPQYFGKWKTTSTFWQMEDDLNLLVNGAQPHDFGNGRWYQILKNGRHLAFLTNSPFHNIWKISSYFPEDLRKISNYFPENFWKISSYFLFSCWFLYIFF